MRPIGSYVLVQTTEDESKKIVLLTDPPKPNTGKVINVGVEIQEVTEGDIVMFRDSFSSTEVPNSPGLLVMHIDNIMLIL